MKKNENFTNFLHLKEIVSYVSCLYLIYTYNITVLNCNVKEITSIKGVAERSSVFASEIFSAIIRLDIIK